MIRLKERKYLRRRNKIVMNSCAQFIKLFLREPGCSAVECLPHVRMVVGSSLDLARYRFPELKLVSNP